MDKYYTPEISDLFIGYECEINTKDITGVDKWIAYTIGDEYHEVTMSRAKFGVRSGLTRTPYLTKEQIEAEGWKYEWWEKGTRNWSKGDIVLTTFDGFDRIKINYPGTYQLFDGKCPSINEFRKICKLLIVKPL